MRLSKLTAHIGSGVTLDKFMELAEKYRLRVIEDAAEVHGAEYKGRKAGSIGDVSCFSFYANKIITSGEGGMVVTGDEEIAERARSYRNLYFRPEKRFYHTELGYNFRMTNLQAAVAFAQLERIGELLEMAMICCDGAYATPRNQLVERTNTARLQKILGRLGVIHSQPDKNRSNRITTANTFLAPEFLGYRYQLSRL